ncbi:MAG: DUF4065 domain-containing protein, partial [Chitinophagaceae bacterium]|nr:DUF4065 domain-containing protein [Chitinophagaceae bacterium]
YNQYRDKFNIPFPDEIIRIREKYGLSAVKMSEILGFGVNMYRQYEAGEMPSVANAKLIQLVDDPNKFIDMLALCGTLDEKTKTKYELKAQHLLSELQRNAFDSRFKLYLMGAHLADIYSGYRNPNFEKFAEMVVYFAEQIMPYKTKLNKLLFYADFLMFKRYCFSVSGMRYKAIQWGPVPNNFQSLFEYLYNNNIIDIQTTEFPNGYIGEQFKVKDGRTFQSNLFSQEEQAVLHEVAHRFSNTGTNDIVNFSHLETAWLNNEEHQSLISYQYAFELKMIEPK